MGPDFLIIGAMKCGTTSLYEYLMKHPKIRMTKRKEVHYFNDANYDLFFLETYKSLFDNSKGIAGSAPQNYTKTHLEEYRKVPERLFRHFPAVKLIYIVRDPIERILSHHVEALSGGYALYRDINECIQDLERSHYVRTSMYFYQISSFRTYFSDDQIMVIDMHELQFYRLRTINKILAFLGVEEICDENEFKMVFNRSGSKSEPGWIDRFIRSNRSAGLRKCMPLYIKRWLKNHIAEAKYIGRRKIHRQQFDEDLQAELVGYLQSDMDELKQYTGLKFASWKNFK